ncbi:neuropeptide receptor 15-like [Dermacentor albipictus]|uniref:neuropeptide receptor 15-like n=1 Tax=Dermacentor albipictus TaxID=60249 RepID=UPI0031FCCCF6
MSPTESMLLEVSSPTFIVNGTLPSVSMAAEEPVASPATIATLASLFAAIGISGVLGNAFVVCAVLGDRDMRSSVTNLFILNLALSDLTILLACVPDIVLFIRNRGWELGLGLCRTLRFIEVMALYASVMTLVSVCVERYVAIVHPMRAHLLCCRKRVRLVIGALWPLSALLAAPNLVYHEIHGVRPGFAPCVMHFPSFEAFVLFKYAEFLLFYLLPLVIQCVLYTIVGLRLFSAESFRSMAPAVGREKYARSVKARRGVIKMLVAGVAVYFISFSPHQVLLLYNTLSSQRFEETWTYLIIVNMMAYTSSACNPLLYSVFSHKFRSKFLAILGMHRRRVVRGSGMASSNKKSDARRWSSSPITRGGVGGQSCKTSLTQV